MDQFLEIKRSQVTAHTLKDYRAVFRNHLSDWMERDLRMISADDLANRYNHIKNKSVKQAKAAMILLNQMWNRLGPLLRVDGERILQPNPIPEVRQMLHGWTKTIPNQPIIPLYQLGGWVARLEDHLARPQTRLGKRSLCGVLLMSLFCGFRNGECRKLKWSDVDLENGFIKLTLTKNRRGHFVAITPYTRKLLTHFHEIRQPGHPYVFPSPVRRGGRMNPIGRGGKNLELLRQEMGFYFSPHSTRRTFASIGGKLRIPKHIIKRLLNHHYQGDVTDLYIKFLEFDPTQMKEYLEEIAEFIIGERDAYRRKLKSK